MSKNKIITRREVKDILELAKCAKYEPNFQQKLKYKKFKAKSFRCREDIVYLNGGLFELEFYKEIIFWCKKLAEDIRLCDKHERSYVFATLSEANCRLQNYEKTIENGHKFIDCFENDIPLFKASNCYRNMVVAFGSLERKEEAFEFNQKLLKCVQNKHFHFALNLAFIIKVLGIQ